jgi:hypothetical protein
MCELRILTVVLIAASLADRRDKPPPAARVRPVRTVTVERGAERDTVSRTGQVRARDLRVRRPDPDACQRVDTEQTALVVR